MKGTHSQRDDNRNMALYRQDENAAPFKSGSAESHRTWHDLMGEIVTLSGDIDILGHDESVAPDDVHERHAHVNLKDRAADLAKAGELLRDTEVSRHSNSFKRTSSFGSLDDLDLEETRPSKKISPMDRLANAVSASLEASLKPPTPTQVLTPQQPQVQKPLLSDYATNADVLAVLGPQDAQLIASYLNQLNVFGFDSPELMLGLVNQMNLFTDMGFKVGHAFRINKLLSDIDNK